MQEHGLIALAAGSNLHVTRPTALDLDATARLLLDVLDVGTTMPDHLSAQIEAWQGIQANGNFLLGPFALFWVSKTWRITTGDATTYPAKLVALNVFLLFTAAEAAFVDQLGQFLLHQLLNHGDSLLEAFFRRAGNVEIQRRILEAVSAKFHMGAIDQPGAHTEGVARLLSG
jgi:hypothetical protein